VSQGTAIAAANSMMMSDVVTMRLKGQVVGQWINQTPQPGTRFGWAPAAMGVLAYVDPDGRLMLLDRDGRRLQVPGATNVILPAWSLDGKQIVYLQKKSQKLFLLMTASVR
jgi:hypothetical protein